MSQSTSNLSFLRDEPDPAAIATRPRNGGTHDTYVPRRTATRGARPRGFGTVATGRNIGIASGVIWLALNNAGVIYSLAQFSLVAGAASQPHVGELVHSLQPDPFLLWLAATAGQISVAGVFIGLGTMIVGYANLFLEKQSVFEQRINEQLNILASADNGGTIQLSRENATMGDHIEIGGDANAAAVGRDASVLAGKISIVKQTVGSSPRMAPEVKQAFASAADAVEKSSIPQPDKEDVAENLKKCADELDKPAPEGHRIVRFIRRIEEVAPAVASVLTSVAAIAKFFTS